MTIASSQPQTKESLRIDVIFLETVRLIASRLPSNKIEFERQALSEVADDADYERPRRGTLAYKEAHIVTINGKRWLLAASDGPRGWPADAYASDILAIKVNDDPNAGKAAELIELGSYFKNSIIIGLYDGRVAMDRKNAIAQKILDGGAHAILGSHIVTDAVENERMMYLDTRPIMDSIRTYDRECIKPFADEIVRVLSDA